MGSCNLSIQKFSGSWEDLSSPIVDWREFLQIPTSLLIFKVNEIMPLWFISIFGSIRKWSLVRWGQTSPRSVGWPTGILVCYEILRGVSPKPRRITRDFSDTFGKRFFFFFLIIILLASWGRPYLWSSVWQFFLDSFHQNHWYCWGFGITSWNFTTMSLIPWFNTNDLLI